MLKVRFIKYSPGIVIPFLINESMKVQLSCKRVFSEIIENSGDGSLQREQLNDCLREWGLELIDLIQTHSGETVSFVSYIEIWESLSLVMSGRAEEILNQIVSALGPLAHCQHRKDPNIEALLKFAARFGNDSLVTVADEIREIVFETGVFQNGKEFLRRLDCILLNEQRKMRQRIH
jgi:hypothetical protein